MVVRLAEDKDIEQLVRLNQEFNKSNLDPSQVLDYMQNCPDNEKTVVAEVDGKIVGFGCMQIHRSWCYLEPWAELTELFVVSNYRNTGLGQAIICFFERLAKNAGATLIILLVNKTNAAGQALYKKCGYTGDNNISCTKEL
jgi:ribosomal protein S18 acetylase RimI-like enzyme